MRGRLNFDATPRKPAPSPLLRGDVFDDDEDDDGGVSMEFWRDFASVVSYPDLEVDLKYACTPLKNDNNAPRQIKLRQEVNASITSLSLSFGNDSDAVLSPPGISPAKTTQNPRFTVYQDDPDDSDSALGGGGGAPEMFLSPIPQQRSNGFYLQSPSLSSGSGGGGTAGITIRVVERSGLDLLSPSGFSSKDVTQTPESSSATPPPLLIQTPAGLRALVVRKPGRLVVDSTPTIRQILEGAIVSCWSITDQGSTPTLGSTVPPKIRKDRYGGFTCTFTQERIRDNRMNKMAAPAYKQRENMPNLTKWSDEMAHSEFDVPLGVFTVKSAYFKGTYSGDLVGKRECGLMYCRDEAEVTVIQSNNPSQIDTVNHIVISVRVGRREDHQLVQVAVHKRVWAHSWLRGTDEVYFPSIPVKGGHTVGLRIHSTVYLQQDGPRDPKTGRVLEARVFITKIALELPSAIQEYLAATAPPPSVVTTRRGLFNNTE